MAWNTTRLILFFYLTRVVALDWSFENLFPGLILGEFIPGDNYYLLSGEKFNISCNMSANVDEALDSSHMYLLLQMPDGGESKVLHSVIVDDRTIMTTLEENITEITIVHLYCMIDETSIGGDANVTLVSNDVSFGVLPQTITRREIHAQVTIKEDSTRVMEVSWCDAIDGNWSSSNMSYKIDPRGGLIGCHTYRLRNNVNCTCLWDNGVNVGQVYYLYIDTSNHWGRIQTPPVVTRSHLTIETRDIVKPGLVQDLVVQRTNCTTLRVKWKEPIGMRAEESLGRMIYAVRIQSLHETRPLLRVENVTDHSYDMHGLDIYTQYSIQVSATTLTTEYWGDPHYITQTTNATEPCAAPHMPAGFYKASTCSSTSAHCYNIALYFQELDPECLHGDLYGYHVTYVDLNAQNFTRYIGAHETSVRLSNITTATVQQVSLYAVVKDTVDSRIYESPRADFYLHELSNALPAVSRVVVETTDVETTVLMTWQTETQVHNFTVIACEENPAYQWRCQSSPQAYTVPGGERSVPMQIEPGKRYVYGIAANQGQRSSGLPTAWMYACSHDRKPSAVVVHANSEEDRISLSWEAPPACDGTTVRTHVTGYHIHWTSQHGSSGEADVSGWDTSYVIPGLRSSTQYDVIVTPYSNAGDGETYSSTVKTASEPGLSGIKVAVIAVGSIIGVIGATLVCLYAVYKWRRRDQIFITEPPDIKVHPEERSDNSDIADILEAFTSASTEITYVPDDGHISNGYAHMGQPDAHMGQPDAHMGQPDAHMGQRDAHMGQPDAHMGQRDAHMGQPDAHMGQRDAHMGQRDAHMGQPDAHMGQRDAHMGQPHHSYPHNGRLTPDTRDLPTLGDPNTGNGHPWPICNGVGPRSGGTNNSTGDIGSGPNTALSTMSNYNKADPVMSFSCVPNSGDSVFETKPSSDEQGSEATNQANINNSSINSTGSQPNDIQLVNQIDFNFPSLTTGCNAQATIDVTADNNSTENRMDATESGPPQEHSNIDTMPLEIASLVVNSSAEQSQKLENYPKVALLEENLDNSGGTDLSSASDYRQVTRGPNVDDSGGTDLSSASDYRPVTRGPNVDDSGGTDLSSASDYRPVTRGPNVDDSGGTDLSSASDYRQVTLGPKIDTAKNSTARGVDSGGSVFGSGGSDPYTATAPGVDSRGSGFGSGCSDPYTATNVQRIADYSQTVPGKNDPQSAQHFNRSPGKEVDNKEINSGGTDNQEINSGGTDLSNDGYCPAENIEKYVRAEQQNDLHTIPDVLADVGDAVEMRDLRRDLSPAHVLGNGVMVTST